MKDYIRLDSKLLISYFKSKFMIVLIYHAQWYLYDIFNSCQQTHFQTLIPKKYG